MFNVPRSVPVLYQAIEPVSVFTAPLRVSNRMPPPVLRATVQNCSVSPWPYTPPPVAADVVVLAGDIGLGTDGVEWAAQHFRQSAIVYVPGNHEAFGLALPAFNQELRACGARCSCRTRARRSAAVMVVELPS